MNFVWIFLEIIMWVFKKTEKLIKPRKLENK